MCTPGENKRVLVVASGGLLGAWQAGAIKALAESGARWDAVAGTSVGAWNAAVLAEFPVGEEVKAAEELERRWFDLSNKLERPRGDLCSLFFRTCSDSLMSDKLLRAITASIRTESVRTSGRPLYVVATSLKSGKKIFVGAESTDLEAVIRASMTVPAFFPPVLLVPPQGSELEPFVDGGLVDAIPTVFTNCQHVDVVVPYPRHHIRGVDATDKSPGLMTMVRATVEHLLERTKSSECDWLRDHNKNVNIIRPLSLPSEILGGDGMANFLTLDKDSVRALFNEGYQFTKLQEEYK